MILTTHHLDCQSSPHQGQNGAWGLALFLQHKMLGSFPIIFLFQSPQGSTLYGRLFYYSFFVVVVLLFLIIVLPYER